MLRLFITSLSLVPAALAACSAGQFSTLSGFAGSNGCVPSGYFQAQDLGYTTEATLTSQCESQCAQRPDCRAFVGQIMVAGDSSLRTGQCFYYSTLPIAPAVCADSPSALIAEYKDTCRGQLSSAGQIGTAGCSSALQSTVTTAVTPGDAITLQSTTTTVSSVTSTNTATSSTVITTVVTLQTTVVGSQVTTTLITTTFTSVMVEISPTITTTTDTAITMPTINPKRKRATMTVLQTVPSYLPSCADFAAYSSACACLGVTASTTTVTVTTPAVRTLSLTIVSSTQTLTTTTTTATSSTTTTSTTSISTSTPVTTISTTSTTTTTTSFSPTATVTFQKFNLKIIGSDSDGDLLYVNVYEDPSTIGYLSRTPYYPTDQIAECVIDDQARMICNGFIVTTLGEGYEYLYVYAQSRYDGDHAYFGNDLLPADCSIGPAPDNILTIAPFQGRDQVVVKSGDLGLHFLASPVSDPYTAITLQAVFL